jgi:hypothetical protein
MRPSDHLFWLAMLSSYPCPVIWFWNTNDMFSFSGGSSGYCYGTSRSCIYFFSTNTDEMDLTEEGSLDPGALFCWWRVRCLFNSSVVMVAATGRCFSCWWGVWWIPEYTCTHKLEFLKVAYILTLCWLLSASGLISPLGSTHFRLTPLSHSTIGRLPRLFLTLNRYSAWAFLS